jgi:hypothetical protein
MKVKLQRFAMRAIALAAVLPLCSHILNAQDQNYALPSATGDILGELLPVEGYSFSGVAVRAYLLTSSAGRPVLLQTCSTSTDKQGEFSCKSVPSGHYILLAGLVGQQVEKACVQGPFPNETWIPISNIDDSDSLLKISPNSEAAVTYQIVPGMCFSGTVATAHNVEQNSLRILRVLPDGARMIWPSSESLKNGGNLTFSGLPTGRYLVTGTTTHADGKGFTATELVIPQRELASLPDAEPSSLELSLGEPRNNDELRLRENASRRVISGVQTKQGLRFSSLPIGSYTPFSLTRPDDCWKSESGSVSPFGVREASGNRFTAEGIFKSCGQATGELASDGAVLAVYQADTLELAVPALKVSRGRFTVDKLASGRYILVAYDGDAPERYAQRSTILSINRDATAFRIDEGKSTDVGSVVLTERGSAQ